MKFNGFCFFPCSCNAETAAKSPSKGRCDLREADLPPLEDSQQPTAMSMATETWEDKPSNETSSDTPPAGNVRERNSTLICVFRIFSLLKALKGPFIVGTGQAGDTNLVPTPISDILC